MTAATELVSSAEVYPPSREVAMQKRELKVCEPERQVSLS